MTYKVKIFNMFFIFLDINECMLGTHNCHNNATCFNTNGSFTCTCNIGHSGNGTKCEGMSVNVLLEPFVGLWLLCENLFNFYG